MKESHIGCAGSLFGLTVVVAIVTGLMAFLDQRLPKQQGVIESLPYFGFLTPLLIVYVVPFLVVATIIAAVFGRRSKKCSEPEPVSKQGH
jgi:hypothetical protein